MLIILQSRVFNVSQNISRGDLLFLPLHLSKFYDPLLETIITSEFPWEDQSGSRVKNMSVRKKKIMFLVVKLKLVHLYSTVSVATACPLLFTRYSILRDLLYKSPLLFFLIIQFGTQWPYPRAVHLLRGLTQHICSYRIICLLFKKDYLQLPCEKTAEREWNYIHFIFNYQYY